MNKNTILINLKNSALCAVLPLLMAACSHNKQNVDAELSDIDARLALVDEKLQLLQNQTDSLLSDSLTLDAKTIALAKEIQTHVKEKSKLKAPKDTIKMKRFDKKIGALKTDSIMNASKVKEQISKNHSDAFRAIYKEQNLLRTKRDSLMKIKSR